MARRKKNPPPSIRNGPTRGAPIVDALSAPVLARLRQKIEDRSMPEPNSGCTLWLAGSNGADYGTVQIEKRVFLAHRASYELVRGPIPRGLVLDHKCRVTFCINPDHLEPMSVLQNSMRSPYYTGRKMYCPSGHPYAGRNLILRTRADRSITRACRECVRIKKAQKKKSRHHSGGGHQGE